MPVALPRGGATGSRKCRGGPTTRIDSCATTAHCASADCCTRAPSRRTPPGTSRSRSTTWPACGRCRGAPIEGDQVRGPAPGLEAPGGGSLNRRAYLPELYARRPPASISEEDAEAVRAVMSAGAVPQRPVGDVPVVPLAESDRHWGGRTVEAGAYEAVIEPFELEPRLKVGELRPIHMRVTNRGTDTWPWDAEAGPPSAARTAGCTRTGLSWFPRGIARASPATCRPARPSSFRSSSRPRRGRASTCSRSTSSTSTSAGSAGTADHRRRRGAAAGAPRHAASALPAPERPRRTVLQRIRRRPADARIPQVVHRVWLGGTRCPANS